MAMVALHAAVAQIRRDVQGLCCPKMGLTIIDERWTRVENAATQLNSQVTQLAQQVARLVEASATAPKDKRFWQRD